MIDDGPLEAALADYFSRLDRGESVELSELIADNPGCEAGLRQFLGQEQNLHKALATASVAVAPHEKLAGRTVGDFRLVRELGRGGMGVVYEAAQLSLGRRIALKVLPLAAMLDKQHLTRFKNEARAAATLNHPNIVPIYSVGSEGDFHYYAMQLIEGQSLAQVIKELRAKSVVRGQSSVAISADSTAPVNGQRTTDTERITCLTTFRAPGFELPALSSREFFAAIARLGVEAAEALEHAHQNGVLHRDIKPANLLVDNSGKLWITDFGLARMQADVGMTMTGELLGTLRYMSPEQALAKRVIVDHRSDIYSLGVTLYELLTLEAAFTGDDRHELLRQIAFDEPRTPRQIYRGIPVELETIVLKAIRKSPEDRYATAHDLAEDLESFLEHKPIKAKPATWREQAVKWSRRHPAAIWATILFLFATTAISAFSTVLITRAYNREAAQRKLAEFERGRAAGHFGAARVAIRNLFHDPGTGLDEWSQLTPSLRQKLVDQAATFYESFLHEGSTDPTLRYDTAIGYRSLALIHNLNNDFPQSEMLLNQSIAVLERLLKEYPDTLGYQTQLALSKHLIGRTLFRLKKFAEADAALVSAISLYKTNISRSPDLGYFADFYECWTALEDQRRSRGDSSKAWMDEIVAAYQDFVSREPGNSVARVHLGDALHHQGRVGDAIATYKEVIRLHPKTLLVHRCLGDALLEKGLREEALAAYREEVRLQPDDHGNHAQIGARLANMGRFDEATAAYREAIRLKPDKAEYHAHLADVMYQQELQEEAASEYKAAIDGYREDIRRIPHDAVAHERFAWMLATCADSNLRDPQEAMQLATIAVELNPVGGNWSTLGVARYRAGNHRGAVEALLKSCECKFNKDEPSTLFFVAMAEWQLGNRDSARNWYTKAIKWIEQPPEIVSGELYRFRAEAEGLLGTP
jgi:eukaryotic-like serine/threonine-protein kinase